MATWLTHLRIAKNIKERVKAIDLEYLMIGSIAPDSGEPDADVDDMAFFNKYLEPEKIFARSDTTRSFLWGYYFHLLTDKLWNDQHCSHASQKEAVDFIRDEMFSLDFEYLKQHGNEIITDLEQTAVNVDFFYDFDTEFIYKNKDRILKFYKGKPIELERPYKFLTQEIVDEFIAKATERCINVLVYGG